MSGRNVAAALAYAGRLGWSVRPLRGKVPAIPNHEPGGHGHLDATTDPETIREFWARYPGSNIGVSCIASGFVALDIDPRHGGDRTLAELEATYGRLPVTVRQRTGGGGEHILFREARDVNFRGSIGPGIDIRYRGGLVVAPSVHLETGRPYIWQPGHHPLETPIAQTPTWLVDLLTPDAEPSPAGQARPALEEDDGWGPKPFYSRAALEWACAAVERAPVDDQNRTLNAEAYSIGRLIGAGLMPRRLAIDCLVDHATLMATRLVVVHGGRGKSNTRSSAPSARASASSPRGSLMSVFQAAERLRERVHATDEVAGHHREWPDPKPLPDGLPDVPPFAAKLLPAVFRGWVLDAAERMQCPPDFPAIAVMIAAGSVIGRQIAIRPKAPG